MIDRLQLCCVACRAPLTREDDGFDCGTCGRHYPIVEGVPVLVADPHSYLAAEIDVVKRVLLDASRRRDAVEALARDIGLPETSLVRIRDVIDTDVARADAFFELLKPARKLIEARAEDKKELGARRRSGWAFDSLLPNLLRDWSNTSELEKTSSIICTALEHALPDPRCKSFVYAGCGAAGLLNRISIDFSQVVGCDLTLPILLAARRLLDAKDLALELPRILHSGRRVTLSSRSDATDLSRVQLLAMDALDMAFADNSVDCILTCFLIDLLPDPQRLADEVHRILSPNGVWINYGPSGPVEALWRFDQESVKFFTGRGFVVEHVSSHRNTYFDLTRDLPSWSYRSHVCYLVTSRKATRPRETAARPRRVPDLAAIPHLVPQHFPHANIVSRQSIGIDETARFYFRCAPLAGRVQSIEIGSNAARIVSLVDGSRTAQEIADFLSGEQTVEQTIQIFAAFFDQGLLNWRDGRIEGIGP